MVKIGSRADVYEGRADKTTGGLTKADIICKVMGGKKLYISQKISNRMKNKFTKKPILKTHEHQSEQVQQTKKSVKFNMDLNTVKHIEYDDINIDELSKEINSNNNSQIQEIDDKQLDEDINELLI